MMLVRVALLRAKRPRRLDLVFCYLAKRHCSIKVFQNPSRQTQLAVAFPQSEYEPGKEPTSPLEIKVDAPQLDVNNLQNATINFLRTRFPETQKYRINFFANPQHYWAQQPINSYKPA